MHAAGEAASADKEAVELFQEKIKNIEQENEIKMNELYNADETGLYWKSLPKKTGTYKGDQHSRT